MSRSEVPNCSRKKEEKEEVAIIGMACLFPGAPDLKTYWENIIFKVDSITDPPAEAWDSEIYYDPDSTENDRVYCKRGGYIGPLADFDPFDNGIMPKAVEGGEPDQWLALKIARDALADAGYRSRPPEAHRTAVILGKGNYLNRGNLSLVQNSLVVDQTLEILKSLHPEYTSTDLATIRQEMKKCLPAFNSDSVAGLIPNIVAGRIANQLDLMGPSYTVDGACASSLLAIDIAARELLEGKIDLALVGGSQITTPVPILGIFCQLNALSRKGQIRPFDKDSDGTILGEGIGMIIIKRRSDAERAGNRIYALIKGVGTSSDGHGLGVLAPRSEGQELAMQRAYDAARILPETVGLIEAHGTGTSAGDAAEMQTLSRVFGPINNKLPWCAVGSIKSMIGHTMPAAGIAGIIKAALSLYHKVLPPTLNVEEPNPKFALEKTPFYINTETRPWIHGSQEAPRRAGVNAFGFGGINAHAILEESRGSNDLGSDCCQHRWDTEVFILHGKSRDELIFKGQQIQNYLSGQPQVELKDLAYTLSSSLGSTPYRLAIVAQSLQELETKLAYALKQLEDQACRQIKDRKGIYFFEQQLNKEGKLAFLFPGEGSQYINMLSDLCMHFPEVRKCFDRMDGIFSGHARGYLLSDFIFPPPVFSEAQRKAAEKKIWEMDGAVEAVLTANDALFALLSQLEVKPDVILGHSTGEYSAMSVSGIFSLIDSSSNGERALELNKNYADVAASKSIPRALLAAVGSDSEKVNALIRQLDGSLYIAMDNCPHQTVIAGAEADVKKAVEEMTRQGIICQVLPFDRPYHTRLFKDYAENMRQFFKRWPISSPVIPIYSCTTIDLFPEDPEEIRKIAVDHWVRPVEFRKTIERMYSDGVRIFVEVGPRGNLSAFVDDILRTKDYIAVPANTERRSGTTQINHLIGILAAHGVPLNIGCLYQYRGPQKVLFDQSPDEKEKAKKPASVIKLATGWPPMRVPADTAKRLCSRVSALKPDSTVFSTDPHSLKEDLSEDVQPSLPFDGLNSAPLPDMESVCQSGSGDSSSNQVMSDYLKTMEQFLELQKQVMHTYLASSDVEVTDNESKNNITAQSSDLPKTSISSGINTGIPVMSEEIAEDHLQTVQKRLIEIVSERTGYPRKMLDLNLDMEADLGIDSIKRTEIIGALNESLGRKMGHETEQIASLKTLQQIVDFWDGILESAGDQSSEQANALNNPEITETKAGFSENEELKKYPFIDRIISFVPGQELTALRCISLDEDLFLLDHTLGGKMSSVDKTLRPLPVMPLTMSMEILAEAASLLVNDKILTGMKNIRAHKWIALEENAVNLKIYACRILETNSEIEVKIYTTEKDQTNSDKPVIEGTMIFGDAYPEPPVVDELSLRNERDSKWTSEELYTKAMFHGPCWQGVSSVDRWGENGSICSLKVLSVNNFFRFEKNPGFVTDPVVLDAAGQVIGFWTMEHLKTGFLIFPFRVKALHIYRSRLHLHQNVRCQARINLEGTMRVLSDIDMIGEDGHLWMRLEGWEDKRFDLPANMYQFLLSPLKVVPSMKWDAPVKPFPDNQSLYCCRTGRFSSGDEEFWMQVFSHLILNHNERKKFRNLGKSGKRKTQWLMGRLAAKDAIRGLLKKHYDIEAGPADIEIGTDGYGRPVPAGACIDKTGAVPALSLAHTNEMAAAIVCNSRAGNRVGFDIEQIRPLDESFIKTAFTSQERSLLDSFKESEQPYLALRFWCAKEALAKALGRGLTEGPHSLSVQGYDAATGTVKVTLRGRLAEEFPNLAKTTLFVHADMEKNYIFTSTVFQGV